MRVLPKFTVCSASFSDCESLGLPFQCLSLKKKFLSSFPPSKKEREGVKKERRQKKKKVLVCKEVPTYAVEDSWRENTHALHRTRDIFA